VYIPVPVAGSAPVTVLNRGDLDVQVTWKDTADNNINGSLSSFQTGEVYRADITISAKNGWSFDPAINFQYPNNSVTEQPGPNGDPLVRSLTTVTYRAAEAPKVIDLPIKLTDLLPAPYAGATAVSSFVDPSMQYSGVVSWEDSSLQPVTGSIFQYGESYTATVELTSAPGFVFPSSLTGANFEHQHDDSNVPPVYTPGGGGKGTVRVTFPPAPNRVPINNENNNYDLAKYIPLPVAGETPVWTFDQEGIIGTVSWDYHTPQGYRAVSALDIFHCEQYRAEITLRAKTGREFVPTNFYYSSGTYGNPVGDQNGTEIRTIMVEYEELIGAFASDNPRAESALKRIAAAKNEATIAAVPLYINLSSGEEPVSLTDGSLGTKGVLLNSSNSPAFVRLDGHDRKIRLTGAPNRQALLTVGSGVTLYLRNITLTGIGNNTTALIWVIDGGTLVLEDGAVVEGNINTYSNIGGGIHVGTGGTLRLAGVSAAIRNNVADNYGGGVGVNDSTGTFIIEAGEITGNTAEYGGGVANFYGNIMIMGGKISGNTVGEVGGGVYDRGGVITMDAGEISGNTVVNRDGGGVYTSGNFMMKGGNISRNSAANGGGVWSETDFTMEGGIISGNTVREFGGGVCAQYGTFLMKGGEISGNSTGHEGGGVYTGNITFTMEGGKISYNSALTGGGVKSQGTFTMKAGIISYNSATYGGGVRESMGTFTMEAGEIFRNKATEGGGVNTLSPGGFTMKGGKIHENEATYGGGVYSGNFMMETGTITRNTTRGGDGGGVYCLDFGSFIKKGGTIYGYHASDTDNSAYRGYADGHAVYVKTGQKRDTDADPSVMLYAKWDSGAWTYNDTSPGGVGDTTANWQ
jgi:hypothetical protein